MAPSTLSVQPASGWSAASVIGTPVALPHPVAGASVAVSPGLVPPDAVAHQGQAANATGLQVVAAQVGPPLGLAPQAPVPPPAFGRRHSPRLANNEDPEYVSMADKATNLKRRKVEGAGKKMAARSVPARAPRDGNGNLSGTLPDELIQLAKDNSTPISLADAVDLASACAVKTEDLLEGLPSSTVAAMEE